MAMPAIRDLQLYEGDTTLYVFQWTDVDGNPFDLSGSAIRLAAKKKITDPNPLFIVNAQVFNEKKGKFSIAFTSESTHDLTGGTPMPLVYDVQATMANGFVRTLFRGQLLLVPEVY